MTVYRRYVYVSVCTDKFCNSGLILSLLNINNIVYISQIFDKLSASECDPVRLRTLIYGFFLTDACSHHK